MQFSESAWVSCSSQIVLSVILSIRWWFLPKPVVLWWVQNNVTLSEVKYLILGTISCRSSVTRNSTYYKAINIWLAMWEIQVRSLGQEDPPEKGMKPTPVFFPGEFHGQSSLAGYSSWGRKELGHSWVTKTLTSMIYTTECLIRSTTLNWKCFTKLQSSLPKYLLNEVEVRNWNSCYSWDQTRTGL